MCRVEYNCFTVHTCFWVLWLGMWLILSPFSAIGFFGCTCAESPDACCSPQKAFCLSKPASTCCVEERHSSACADECRLCAGAPLKPNHSALQRISLELSVWVLTLPEPVRLESLLVRVRRFCVPNVRNHSPPHRSLSPRAPPLC